MTYGSEKAMNQFLKLISADPVTMKRYLEAYGWFTGGATVHPRRNIRRYYEELFNWLDDLEVNPVTFLYWITRYTDESVKMLKKGPAYLLGSKNKEKFRHWLQTYGPDVQYKIISRLLERNDLPPTAEVAARVEKELKNGRDLNDLPETDVMKAANQLMGIPCLRQLCDLSREKLEREVEGGIVWIQ